MISNQGSILTLSNLVKKQKTKNKKTQYKSRKDLWLLDARELYVG